MVLPPPLIGLFSKYGAKVQQIFDICKFFRIFFAFFLYFYCFRAFFHPKQPQNTQKSTDRVVSASVWAFTRERLGCLLVKAGGLYIIEAGGLYSIKAGDSYSIEAGGVLIIDGYRNGTNLRARRMYGAVAGIFSMTHAASLSSSRMAVIQNHQLQKRSYPVRVCLETFSYSVCRVL